MTSLGTKTLHADDPMVRSWTTNESGDLCIAIGGELVPASTGWTIYEADDGTEPLLWIVSTPRYSIESIRGERDAFNRPVHFGIVGPWWLVARYEVGTGGPYLQSARWLDRYWIERALDPYYPPRRETLPLDLAIEAHPDPHAA